MSLSTHTTISFSDQAPLSEQLLALLTSDFSEVLSNITNSLGDDLLESLQSLVNSDDIESIENFEALLEAVSTVLTAAVSPAANSTGLMPFGMQTTLGAFSIFVSAYRKYQSSIDSFLQSQSPELAAFVTDAVSTVEAALTAITTYQVPEGAAAFTTVATNGDRLYDGNTNGATELKWTNTVTRSDGSQATTVDFAFDNEFSLNGVDVGQAKNLFRSALLTWSNYAPIDFQEVVDPGSTSGVDILVQSRNIDGANNILAEAYFPTFGDITFDTSEIWDELKFLEVTVHELGHSLGLDHEDDVPSIMGSTLTDQFTDPNNPFLQPDDVAGIQHLYGEGQGSVRRLDGTVIPSNNAVTASQSNPNLVENGSFEDTSVGTNDYGLYENIRHWSTLSGTGVRVDKRTAEFGQPTDGEAWVALDIGNNATIGQNIDTLTGQRYILSVDYSNNGQAQDTAGIDVFWDGEKVDSLTGGGVGNWRTFNYELIGGNRQVGGRNVNTLALRATGASDSIGGLIDNISVRAVSGASALTQLGVTSQQATAGLNAGLSAMTDIAPDIISSDTAIDTQLAPDFLTAAPSFV